MERFKVVSSFESSQSKDLNMKVLAALVLAIGSVAALGSGPYLPSGWKPQGPAFFLPSEEQKPSPINIVLQESESEGSSSDFLREYGPPDVQVSQSLPRVATEQPFVVIEAKFGQDEAVTVGATADVIAEQKTEVIEETQVATESVANEETNSEPSQELIQGKSVNLDVRASLIEEVPAEDDVVVTVSADEVNARIGTEVQQEVKVIEEGVKNIAEAIVNLEKEALVEQQVQEGFLEYGPPGFREYGPPNQNYLLRSNDEVKSEAEKIDNNETRRRRFSPKFRSTKKKY